MKKLSFVSCVDCLEVDLLFSLFQYKLGKEESIQSGLSAKIPG